MLKFLGLDAKIAPLRFSVADSWGVFNRDDRIGNVELGMGEELFVREIVGWVRQVIQKLVSWPYQTLYE